MIPSTTSTAGAAPRRPSSTRSAGSRTSGAVEEHVGRDGGEHQGPHAGREHRSAGREVVGRRPGRRGHHQTVGRVGDEGAPVDRDGDPNGVAGHRLLDGGLVERGALGTWPPVGIADARRAMVMRSSTW